MDFQEWIKYRLSQRNFVHDLSLGSLLVYQDLIPKLENDKVRLAESGVLITGKKDKTTLYIHTDKSFGSYLLNTDTRISNEPIPGEKHKSKQKEIFYMLSNIDSHTGKKKYHSLSKPLKIMEREDLGIEIRDISQDLAEQAELIALHNEWVDYKLSLPSTHRISFPTARYRRTLGEYPIPMYKKAIYIKGKLYGFIVFSLENGVAFELSFVTHFWKPEFKILNGLNQYLFSYFCIDLIRNHNIQFVNSGFALNKKLEIFKTTSQKSYEVYKYTY